RKGTSAAGVQATLLALGDDSAGHAQAGPDRPDRGLSAHAGVAGRRGHLLRHGTDRAPPGGREEIGRAHVWNSSHVKSSYAVFCLKKKGNDKRDADAKKRTLQPPKKGRIET